MLNFENQEILRILKELVGTDNTFKIIEADEVIELLPQEIKIDKEALANNIRDLSEREFLKVKYLTTDEYCLQTLHRADDFLKKVQEVETVVVEEPIVKEEKVFAVSKKGEIKKQNNVPAKVVEQPIIKSKMLFISSFLGGLIGGGIVAGLVVLIQLLLV